MNKRSALDSQAAKKRDLALLRKKNDKMEPIFNVERQQSPLFNTVTMNKEMQNNKKHNAQLMAKELQNDQDFFLPKTNRIYNSNTRNVQSYRGTNRLKDPRTSLKNLKKEQDQILQTFQDRPMSSQVIQVKKNQQVFKDKNQVLNNNRPGSSKSSRLFKRKGPFANDTINSQNEEGQALIRVTSISSRAGTSYIKGKQKQSGTRNRVGTSLPQRGVQKIPSKIDPQFFRLFAQ